MTFPSPHRSIAAALLLILSSTGLVAAPRLIQADLNATEFHRQLIRMTMEFPVEAGPLHLWYPQWIPGIHAPYGPIQNVAGLRLTTTDGTPLQWSRDPEQLFRISSSIPAGVERIRVQLDYICSQPSVNSRGIDSYGTAQIGVINWNTCLLYPEGISIDDLQVQIRLRLPDQWKFGTALKIESRENNSILFQPETFRTVIDSPLVAGEHFKSITLPTRDVPASYLHLASESPSAIELNDTTTARYGHLMTEAGALFGGHHFEQYHFLLACSDQLPGLGLEHLSSSLNAVPERDLVETNNGPGRAAYLLPHELVHSWCGKHRLPATMWTTNYHTPKDTRLLWIYEGLTTYLGDLLAVRSGLVSLEEYTGRLSDKIDLLMRQKGRQWRSLEDTAIASHQLRASSPSWGNLRRGQDYYNEGLLFWLEADLLIRRNTDGAKSLDDFCRRFMGPPNTTETIKTYELKEVTGILRSLADHDWEKLISERILQPQQELPLELVTLAGYRLEYHTEPTEYVKRGEKNGTVFAFDSLGIVVNASGQITTVVPGLPGDQAGLAPGMTIQGVNGRKFSSQKLKDAIAESVTKRTVDLLILEGDRFTPRSLPYDGGLKYLRLTRNPTQPDLLKQIFKPRRDSGPGKA